METVLVTWDSGTGTDWYYSALPLTHDPQTPLLLEEFGASCASCQHPNEDRMKKCRYLNDQQSRHNKCITILINKQKALKGDEWYDNPPRKILYYRLNQSTLVIKQ
jgi:hypothetical protein